MLPPGDRPVVARALAKKPGGRWESCAAFVAALRAAPPRGEPGQAGASGDDGAAAVRREVAELLGRYAVADRPLRLGDGGVLVAPPERQRVAALVARARQLPEGQRGAAEL